MDVIQVVSRWAVPVMLFSILFIGFLRGINVFEAFVEGAAEGFETAVKIIPYLVAMFVAVEVFRDSGAMALMVKLLHPVLGFFGIPGEVLPLAIMRPLSGGASLGIAADLISVHGPDSFVGQLASTMQGSTDTTFYILTVYFGSVGITKFRYSPIVGLIADLTGFVASFYVCTLFFK